MSESLPFVVGSARFLLGQKRSLDRAVEVNRRLSRKTQDNLLRELTDLGGGVVRLRPVTSRAELDAVALLFASGIEPAQFHHITVGGVRVPLAHYAGMGNDMPGLDITVNDDGETQVVVRYRLQGLGSQFWDSAAVAFRGLIAVAESIHDDFGVDEVWVDNHGRLMHIVGFDAVEHLAYWRGR